MDAEERKKRETAKESGKDDCFYNKVNVEKLRAHHEKRRSISKPVAVSSGRVGQ